MTAPPKPCVFDVAAGRNPVATGGIEGPNSFAPLDLPPVQQVASPVAFVPSQPVAPVLPDPELSPPAPRCCSHNRTPYPAASPG